MTTNLERVGDFLKEAKEVVSKERILRELSISKEALDVCLYQLEKENLVIKTGKGWVWIGLGSDKLRKTIEEVRNE